MRRMAMMGLSNRTNPSDVHAETLLRVESSGGGWACRRENCGESLRFSAGWRPMRTQTTLLQPAVTLQRARCTEHQSNIG